MPPLVVQLLWAKTSHDHALTHPLICHLIDVAEVAAAMWRTVLPNAIRLQIAAALGMDTDSAGHTLAFWAVLHDLGKASPAFQRRHSPSAAKLAASGLAFPPLFAPKTASHGTITAWAIERLLTDKTGASSRIARRLAVSWADTMASGRNRLT